MNAKTEEMKCPACGAPMIFDPVNGNMKCEYCGTVQEIAAPSGGSAGDGEKEELSGFDFHSLGDQALKADAEEVPIYNCNSCGAELIAPPEQAALTCPYCGNNIVLSDKVSGKLRPDGLIPFQIDPKSLPGSVQKFYRGKRLLPKRFFADAHMEKVTGVYVPFWVFDGQVSGQLTFSGEKRHTHREGDYEITETAHYSLEREVSMSFAGVPVDASGRIDDALMDSMEPFQMEDVVPFDMRYLAGYTADRFDVAKEEMADRAKGRMFSTAEAVVRPKVETEFSAVRRKGGKLSASLTAKYLLLPVYLFSIRFGDKDYAFAVNGQTGKVVGELPMDKRVGQIYFLTRFAGAAAAFVLLFIIKYLLGR